ncbi:hypothetical protein EC957_002913 [Mortierella hygrophila]|uniref:F-box domain-containing protein n=1 Tax=Mortierella hygrophila TaxID=979708 RepID=A0A9P6F4L2_9FUNG|nr:hypothetical protein EC957_002913 [Mortierella hygrophila]
MTMILDLPEEIHLLIVEHLNARAIYACIRTCRTFYRTFVPRLWSDLSVKQYKREPINADLVRANTHLVEAISYSSTLTDDYYTIVYPRLHTLRFDTVYAEGNEPTNLQVTPLQKVEFAHHHPSIRKLIYHHKDTLPKEFWEVVETEWTELESLEMSGNVEDDAVDPFWRACDRAKTLYFSHLYLPESVPILSTLSFQHLQDLRIKKYPWQKWTPHRMWPIQLLEQVRGSERLRRLAWDVNDIAFPARMIMDAFAEDCWPDLQQLIIGDTTCSDQDLAGVLEAVTSRRLAVFEYANGKLGPLTYKCLQERYFRHLKDLNLGKCTGVTSAMAQEILMECTHLVDFDAPHIFVRDIVKASKPWGCSKIQTLVIYIAKQPDDEAGWDGLVFQQISKLRRLQSMDLQRDPHCSYFEEESRPEEITDLATLDFRLDARSKAVAVDHSGGNERGGVADIRCWSSLVQLKELSFDGDRQTLGMDELVWMTEHWRDLWCVCGGFKGIVSPEDCIIRDRLCLQSGLWIFD